MGVLNFSTDKLITGANIIEGNLYWTDDNSEPKKIDIERWKNNDVSISGVTTTINGAAIEHTDVTVIRPHPYEVIKLEIEDYDTYAEAQAIDPRDTLPEPPFENIFPRFSYRWRYEDGQYSVYAPFTQAAFIPKARLLESTGTRGVQEGDIDDATGQITTDFFVPSSAEANYTEGYNTTMFNNAGRITLTDIPRGTKDVVAVDLLYTESISGTIYILETLEIPEAQRGLDYVVGGGYDVGAVDDYDLLPLTYEITSRKIYRALPEDQLVRDFDNVPRLAKSQEVTANRLIYGNYLHNFDQPSSVTMTVNAIEAESYPFLYPDRYPLVYAHQGNADWTARTDAARQHLLVDSLNDGLHVKGNRSYEIGVAYIDGYGRIGGMLQTGSVTGPDGAVSEAGAFRMPFRQFYRQRIVSRITSPPPAWADKYRFYIKDVSMDHHNLVSYNSYNDGGFSEASSPYIWVEFQSTDRNKILEDTILVPRRVNEEIRDNKTRHLVQDIQNEAPALVRAQIGGEGSNSSGRSLGATDHGALNMTNGFTRTNQVPSDGATELYIRDERIDFSESGFLQRINRYIGDQGIEVDEAGTTQSAFDVDRQGSHKREIQTADLRDTEDLESFLYVRFHSKGRNEGMTNWMRVTGLTMSPDSDRLNTGHRTGFKFDIGDNVLIAGTSGTDPEIVGIVPCDTNGDALTGGATQATGFNLINGFTRGNGPGGLNATGGSGTNWEMEFAQTELSEEALERLQGRFWVKIPRSGLTTSRSEFNGEGELTSLNQTWFETEPAVADSNLDLFWESSQTFCVCTDHGYPNKIEWANCVVEVESPEGLTDAEIEAEVLDGTPNWGPYLEATRINDRFNTPQLVRGVRANTPVERYAEERRGQGLIWSGIFNSKSGVNRLNQFALAHGIQKELEPNYGTLQKLHTRDTNIIAFTEDKVFKILADKDQLFNADGGGNVSASNAVLGQTTPFNGEYGISTNPESFASYGHNIYFTDANRGAVLQCTPNNGQIFEISSRGMNDVFRDRLFSADKIWGMFDNYTDKYILSIQDYDQNDAIIDQEAGFGDDGNLTFGYELDVEGWSSRFSYIPESGLSLNNKFYTFKDGKIWQHNSNTVDRNNFYGEQYNSHVDIIFNDQPSAVKEFLTISYEGSDGWDLEIIDTDNDEIFSAQEIAGFVKKEGKFFAPILQSENVYQVVSGASDAVADDGTNLEIIDVRTKGGRKGFYAQVRMVNDSTDMAELFAVNTESFISSN